MRKNRPKQLNKIIIITIVIITIITAYQLAQKEQNKNTEDKTSETENIPFQIIIPQINLDKPIIPNVDPRQEMIYKKAFQKGIAHGLGTKFPNEIGNTYLFAHSTKTIEEIELKYGWFTRIDELKNGDKFAIIYGNNKYQYIVTEKEIVSPQATGIYTAYAPVQMVTLQTCYPRGEIEKRLIIKAILVNPTSTEKPL